MSNDHELMQRLAEEDAEAFETLVRRWEGPVRRIVVRLSPVAAIAPVA